ncbi:MAG: hypothetical protein AAB638_02775 [Patescibacteria group bacterium]
MELPKTTQELPPYSISVEEFSQPPQELKTYKVGDKITRENFNSFLMQSFAISRGQVIVQIMFMAWIKTHTGFDYESTVDNLLKSGGWDAFSELEKSEFLSKFRSVKKHTDKYLDFEHEDEVKNEIEGLENNITKFHLKFEDLYDLQSPNFSDFQQLANTDVERLRKMENSDPRANDE